MTVIRRSNFIEHCVVRMSCETTNAKQRTKTNERESEQGSNMDDAEELEDSNNYEQYFM